MQVKEIDINTGKIKGYGICKKKKKISFLSGPTTPTYSIIQIIFVGKFVSQDFTVRVAPGIS